MKEPYTETTLTVCFEHWRLVISESTEADGCCAVHYEEDVEKDGKKTVRKYEPVSIGEPKSARAVAAAIIQWCDIQEAKEE